MSDPVIIDNENLTPTLSYEERELEFYVSGENVPEVTPTPPSPVPQGRVKALALAGEVNIGDIERLAYEAAVAIREWYEYDAANARVDLRLAEVLVGFVTKIVNPFDAIDGMYAWTKLHVKSGRPSAQTVAEYRAETLDHLLWLLERGQSPIEVGLRDMESYRAFLLLEGSPAKMAAIRAKWLGQRSTRRSSIAVYSATAVAKKLTVVRVFYGIAVKREVLSDNPAAKIDLPKDGTSRKEKVKEHTLSVFEMSLVAQSFRENDPSDIRDYAIIKLGSTMGLRVSEVEKLNLDDLDLNDIDASKDKFGVLRIRHAKGDKNRALGIPRKVRAALEKWLAVRDLMKVDSEALFVSMNWSDSGRGRKPGERLSKRGIQAMWEARLKRLHIKRAGVGFHALRHFAGTQITLAGKSTKMLSMYLGHSNEATTSIYQDIVDEQMENVAAAADW